MKSRKEREEEVSHIWLAFMFGFALCHMLSILIENYVC